jgi:electron transfer flavoprotein beta subunit
MNIVVCLKHVPDTSGPIRIDKQKGSIIEQGLHFLPNPYDSQALEEAVRLKEKIGDGEVILVSMGPPSARKTLRRCLARGADRALLLCDSDNNLVDSHAKAFFLSKIISDLEFELIICGQKAIDTEAGQVGAFIAEIFNIPMVSRAVRIDLDPSYKRLTISRKLQRGDRETVETKLPALVTVEMGLNRPRYPSLSSRLDAQKKRIKEYNLENLKSGWVQAGFIEPKTKIVSVSLPKPKKIFTPESSLSAAERARLVMTGGLSNKKARIIRGNPKQQALALVGFLKQKKLI